MQIQIQTQTNKPNQITKAKRPPTVCVVLHIQVQLLDKCYDQQTSRQVFALRQFSILSRVTFLDFDQKTFYWIKKMIVFWRKNP